MPGFCGLSVVGCQVLEDPVGARIEAARRAAVEKSKQNNHNLLEAAKLGDERWMDELLDEGADIHFRDVVRRRTR